MAHKNLNHLQHPAMLAQRFKSKPAQDMEEKFDAPAAEPAENEPALPRTQKRTTRPRFYSPQR